MKGRFISCFFIVLVLLVSPLQGQDGSSSIKAAAAQGAAGKSSKMASYSSSAVECRLEGTVVMREGDSITPVEAVEIHVSKTFIYKASGMKKDSLLLSTLTDENGRFSVNLKPGIYHLTYRQMGEILKYDTVRVYPQQTKQNTLNKKISGASPNYKEDSKLTSVVSKSNKESVNATSVVSKNDKTNENTSSAVSKSAKDNDSTTSVASPNNEVSAKSTSRVSPKSASSANTTSVLPKSDKDNDNITSAASKSNKTNDNTTYKDRNNNEIINSKADDGWKSCVVDIGNVVIDPKSIQLSEVTVKAQRKLLTYEQGKMYFNVKESPYAEGFSAKEVLQHIPGMDPNPDRLAMIGKDGLIVLVNGRRTNLSGDQLKHYLQSIGSDKIEKIEVQTNPGVEYAASGNSGIINIILKKNAYLGWDGNVWTVYEQKSKPSTHIGGSINYSNKHILLSYQVNGGYVNMRNLSRSKYDYGDTNVVFADTLNFHNAFYMFHGLSANWFITKKMDLGFNSYVYAHKPKNLNEKASSATYIGDSIVFFSWQKTDYDDKNPQFSVSPYYEWRFDESGKKLTLSYDYSLFHPLQNQRTFHRETLDTTSTETESKTFSHIGRIDVKLPFDWLGFEFGGFYEYTKDHATAASNISESYECKEQVTGSYIDVYRAFGKFNLKVGTRYEHTLFKGMPTGEEAFKNKYGNWFPFVDLGLSPTGEHTINLGYNRKIDRPSMYQYNPVKWYDNGYNYQTGNPELKPTITDNVELKYIFSNLYVYLTYSHGKDGIASVQTIENDTVTATSYSNGLSFHKAGGTVSYSYYHKRFSISGGGTVYYYQYKSSNPRIDDSDMEGWSPRLFANGTLNVGKHTMFTANYFCDFKGFGGVFDMDIPIHNELKQGLDLGVNFKFLQDKLTIGLNVYDIFGTNVSRHRTNFIDTNGRRYTYYSRQAYDSRYGSLKISYRFGNDKTKYSNVEVQSGNDRIKR